MHLRNNTVSLRRMVRWLLLAITFLATPSLFAAPSVSAGGNHTCAVHSNGGVQCWGYINTEQQGDDNTASRSSLPVTVSGLGEVTAMATGELHTCALLANREVQC